MHCNICKLTRSCSFLQLSCWKTNYWNTAVFGVVSTARYYLHVIKELFFWLMLYWWDQKQCLYVLVMSFTRFRVNPHSIIAWMSRNSLLEGGAKVKWNNSNNPTESSEQSKHVRSNTDHCFPWTVVSNATKNCSAEIWS